MALAGDEPYHLTADWEITLCGVAVHSGAYQPTRYDARKACRVCRKLAKERGLTVETT